jgi:hypothetical protein
MRLWHKKPKPETFRTKRIDWSKVKTVDDVILILKNYTGTKDIMVDEKYWKYPEVAKLLGSTVTESTYEGSKVTHKEYEE